MTGEHESKLKPKLEPTGDGISGAQREVLSPPSAPGTPSAPAWKDVKDFHYRDSIDQAEKKLPAYGDLGLVAQRDPTQKGDSNTAPKTDTAIPGNKPHAEATRRAMRAKLNTLAEQKLDDRTIKAFKNNLNLLEAKWKGKDDEHKIVGDTLAQIPSLFEAKGNPRANEEQLRILGRQIAYNAARVTRISQGKHLTCSAAAIEVRHYALYPNEAAEKTVKIALDGKLETKSVLAPTIEPDPESLKPDSEARLSPVPDGKRNYASQLYQNAAIQAYWSTQDYLTDGGKFRYKQVEPEPKIPNDTGERLIIVDKDGKQKEVIANDPNMTPSDIAGMSEIMTGRREAMVISAYDNNDNDDRVLVAHNEQELEKVLLAALKGEKYQTGRGRTKTEMQYKLPMLACVYTMDGQAGAHVVTILDYDPKTRTASVNNTWKSSLDHTGEDGALPPMPIAVLATAMQKPRK